jgi:hypothetical protein
MVWNVGDLVYTDFGSVKVMENTGDAAARRSRTVDSGGVLFE